MTIQEKMKALFAHPMKLILVSPITLSILSDCFPREREKSNNKRVTTNAVYIEVAIPIESVTPKPRTGPLPITIMMRPAIKVVKLPSKMTPNARS